MRRSARLLLLGATTLTTISAAFPMAGPAGADTIIKKVNFQPAGSAVPAGYAADSGAAYSGTRGFGWVKAGTSSAVSVVGRGIDRNEASDQRIDTFIPMNFASVDGSSTGARLDACWELAVANGDYRVTVGAGDAGQGGEQHTVIVEGTTAIDFKAGAATRTKVATVDVKVADGKLTVGSPAFSKTKITYVDVVKVGGTTTPTTTPPVTTPPTTVPPTTVPPTTPPTTVPPVAGGAAKAKLGFYPGFADEAELRRLEGWLGREVGYVAQFGGRMEVGDLTGSSYGVINKAGAGFGRHADRLTLSFTVPLGFGKATARTTEGVAEIAKNLKDTAAGTNDAAYRTVAQRLKDGGYPDAIIRLGHEFDGAYYPYSAQAGNAGNYKAAFRHVVGVMRSVAPDLKFDYNGIKGAFVGIADAAYPGDDVVDIIGLDVYDQGGFKGEYDAAKGTWTDPATTFEQTFTPLLQFQLDFAKKHGKQVSYPEWALSGGGSKKEPHGGDNPTFIKGMYDWFNALPKSGGGSLAYATYFNEGKDTTGPHNLDSFPKAAAEFKKLFG